MNVINNKKNFAFEIALASGEIASVTYRWLKGRMVLMHTFVPKEAAGMGIGDTLARHALEHAKSHRLKVVIYCPFIAHYISKHPEYAWLVDKGK